MNKIITILMLSAILILVGCGGREKVEVKYPNGSLKTVYYQIEKDGEKIPDGPAVQYYENGKMMFEYSYVMGEMTGDYKKFYESGKISEQGTLEKGITIGENKLFHQNGKIKRIGFFNERGMMQGKFIEYDESGKTLSEKDYNNGK